MLIMLVNWQKEKLAERIGEQIKDIIEDQFGGNKSKFGKLLGIDNSGVNKIVTGQRSGLSYYQMYQLHKHCNQDLNILVTNGSSSVSLEQENTTNVAQLEVEHARKEIEYLKKIIQDKEELLATKDMVIDYLKMRVTNLIAELEEA